MSNNERTVRLNIAKELIDKVYDDLCNEPMDVISKGMTTELCDIIIKLNVFIKKLN